MKNWTHSDEKKFQDKIKNIGVARYVLELHKFLWSKKCSDEMAEKICFALERLNKDVVKREKKQKSDQKRFGGSKLF